MADGDNSWAMLAAFSVLILWMVALWFLRHKLHQRRRGIQAARQMAQPLNPSVIHSLTANNYILSHHHHPVDQFAVSPVPLVSVRAIARPPGDEGVADIGPN
ncbi:hypothetical protein RI367_003629 [Sorochytrium milnesiophthora]